MQAYDYFANTSWGNSKSVPGKPNDDTSGLWTDGKIWCNGGTISGEISNHRFVNSAGIIGDGSVLNIPDSRSDAPGHIPMPADFDFTEKNLGQDFIPTED